MGSWNGTCGVTHLPIYSGDDVVLLFLTNGGAKDFSNGMIYPNQSWSPCFFPVYGKYDDYGSVEEIDESSCITSATYKIKKSTLIRGAVRDMINNLNKDIKLLDFYRELGESDKGV